jgi:hypothetical protein
LTALSLKASKNRYGIQSENGYDWDMYSLPFGEGNLAGFSREWKLAGAWPFVVWGLEETQRWESGVGDGEQRAVGLVSSTSALLLMNDRESQEPVDSTRGLVRL